MSFLNGRACTVRWRARLSALGPTLTLFPAEFKFCPPSGAAGVVPRLLVPYPRPSQFCGRVR